MSTTDYTLHLKEGVVVKEGYMDELVNNPAYPIQKNENAALICFNAPSATTVTILGNDSIFGGKNLTVSVPEGRSYLYLNIGPYLQVSGKNKGKIKVTSEDYSITATFIALP